MVQGHEIFYSSTTGYSGWSFFPNTTENSVQLFKLQALAQRLPQNDYATPLGDIMDKFMLAFKPQIAAFKYLYAKRQL